MCNDDRMARADRLEEIKDEIKTLLGEAGDLLSGTDVERRARFYWLASMHIELDDDHEWVGKSMHSMQDTIDELREADADDDMSDDDDMGEAEA